MSIKRLYLIGNGFDQHHGIKSSYWAFRDWLKDNDCEFANQIAYIFDFLPNRQNSWGNLEESLCEISPDVFDLGLSGIPTIILAKGGDDIVSFCTPFQELGYTLRDALNELLMRFTEWVESYSKPLASEIIAINRDEAFFINFNYTNTLEDLYGVPNKDIWHIHGQTGDDRLIFGHNTSKREYLQKMSDSYQGAKSNLNKCASMINSARKPITSIISKNKGRWNKLREVSEVYVYGLSCSNVDIPYLEKIKDAVSPDANWTFSWFKPFDPQSIEDEYSDYHTKLAIAQRIGIHSPKLMTLDDILINKKLF